MAVLDVLSDTQNVS